MGTNGLVANWYCLANNKEAVAGGLMPELCQDLYDRGYIDPSRGPEFWQFHKRGFGFNAEGLKILLDEYCANAQVEVRFETQVVDIDANTETGEVKGVIVNNVEGFAYIPTKTVIDATGDAKICANGRNPHPAAQA